MAAAVSAGIGIHELCGVINLLASLELLPGWHWFWVLCCRWLTCLLLQGVYCAA